ncbi:hypothetical protein BG004_000143 [Podila humilis]|nr:hypothetical protein BG004_000143 [Podila humilis]
MLEHRLHFYALHIPEIAGIIVSFLTWRDLLVCRGVSHEWRSLFSPHLRLSAIYWKQNPDDRAKLVHRLETLGPFVDSLRVVYPFAQELETISRTCPALTHIGFFFSYRDTPAINIPALQQFLSTMHTLERIDVFSHNDDARTAILYCLATYPSTKPSDSYGQLLAEEAQRTHTASLDATVSSASIIPDTCTRMREVSPGTSTAAIPTTAANIRSGDALKQLKIEHGGYSMKVALLHWQHVEAVLARNQSITCLHLQEAIVKTDIELAANPEDEQLDWTEDTTPRVLGSLPLKRRIQRFLEHLSSLSIWRRSTTDSMPTVVTTTTGAGTSTIIREEGSSSLLHNMQQEPFPATLSFARVQPELNFINIKSIVLHHIILSKSLYCSLLRRCPCLTTLEVTGTGTMFRNADDSPGSLWDWLEYCPLLESILIDQRVQMDVREVWARAPACLRTFQMNDLDWTMTSIDSHFTGSGSKTAGIKRINLNCLYTQMPGSSLTQLHLETNQHIGEPAIHYVMEYCRSLQRLCLAVKTYHPPNFSKHYNDYPEWSCGETLRVLEIKTLHQSYDETISLETVQKFLRRVSDLNVLEEVLLPLPLVGDLYRMSKSAEVCRATFSPPVPSVRKLTLKGYHENQLWSDNIRILTEWMPGLQVLWTPYGVFDRPRLDAIKEM